MTKSNSELRAIRSTYQFPNSRIFLVIFFDRPYPAVHRAEPLRPLQPLSPLWLANINRCDRCHVSRATGHRSSIIPKAAMVNGVSAVRSIRRRQRAHSLNARGRLPRLMVDMEQCKSP